MLVIIPAADNKSRRLSFRSKLTIHDGRNLAQLQVEAVRKVFPSCIVRFGIAKDEHRQYIPTQLGRVGYTVCYNYTQTSCVATTFECLKNYSPTNVLILMGDTYLTPQSFMALSKEDAIGTYIGSKKNSVGVIVSNDRATNFAYGLNPSWANCLYITKRSFNKFYALAGDRRNHGICFHELLNSLQTAVELKTFNCSGVEVDTHGDVKLIENLI